MRENEKITYSILAFILLIACSGCIWGWDRGRGGHGDQGHGGYDDRTAEATTEMADDHRDSDGHH